MCVSKFVRLDCKRGRIGFMCHQSPLWGWGGVYTRFALGFVCLTLPPLYFFSYLALVLSPSRLWTHMSSNSSLESQAFVKRASTGNRLLWLRKPIKRSLLSDHKVKTIQNFMTLHKACITHTRSSFFMWCSIIMSCYITILLVKRTYPIQPDMLQNFWPRLLERWLI